MDFTTCFNTSPAILMEGALGERLKREYGLLHDETLGLSAHVYSEKGRVALKELFGQYIEIARRHDLPVMLTTPTRRANRERVALSPHDNRIIIDNVTLLREVKGNSGNDVFLGGLMGCKGDAYKATGVLSEEEAVDFHSWQTRLFVEAGVDFLYAGIMPALSEAIGMSRAMAATGLPYIISFMIREDGRLIDGTTIHDAITAIDAVANPKPTCYMTNCVHPAILKLALSREFNQTGTINNRFRGIQANTSPLSPEELDNAVELKTTGAEELSAHMLDLHQNFNIKILGGCCGTDKSHMDCIAKRLFND